MVVKKLLEILPENRQVSEFKDITQIVISDKMAFSFEHLFFKIGMKNNLPVKLRDEQTAVVIWLKCSGGGGLVCISLNLV